jgi:phosphoribosylglycinamide formyltransferase-1
LRVAVLASGTGTNLQALLDRVHGREGIEIVAVASDKPAAPALDRARRAEVSVRAFPLAEFGDRAGRDRAMGEWLLELGAELVVLAGYMQLLSDEFLAGFPDRVINVHPALLPAFPGLTPVPDALTYGAKVDSGPVLLQRAIELPDATEAEAVFERLHPIEHELLPEAVRLIARGAVSFDPANPRRVVIDR